MPLPDPKDYGTNPLLDPANINFGADGAPDVSKLSPGANPNQPTSYAPSSEVNTIAPVIAQITGGDMGNTLAGVQGAVKADNSFFGNIGSIVSDVSSKLGAAFNSGVATGSNPADISAKVDQLAQSKAAALISSGQAGAAVTLEDGLHKAAAADATAKDAVRLGLDPNNPDAIDSMNTIREAMTQVTKYNKDILNMNTVGFFDNPVSYLMNHLINIPIAQSRGSQAAAAGVQESEMLTKQTEALRDRSITDTALNSVDTTNRATELFKQALSSAAAVGIEPLIQAKQISISAYDLGVAQQNSETSARNSAMEAQLLPGKLSLQTSQSQWYDASHSAIIEQANARADEMRSMMLKRDKDAQGAADNLTSVNNVYKSLGLDGNLKDLGLLRDKQKSSMYEMASNLQTSGQIANDPARALELIRESGVSLDKIPAGQLSTVKNIDTLYNSSLDKALQVQPGESKPTGAALQDKVKGFMTQSLVEEQRRGFDSNNKFYTMPSAGTLIDRPWAKSNPIIQALRPLAVDSSGQAIRRDVDGSLLLNTAATLVKNKTLSEAQAVQALRDTGMNILNDVQTAGGFKRFAVPVQQMFPVTYQKTGFSFGSSGAKADLLDSSQTLNALRRQVGGLVSQDMSYSINAMP